MSSKKGPTGDIGFNYVPLIDVTFNLILFFALTSEMSNTILAQVLVATPQECQAQRRDKLSNNSVMVNVVSRALNDKAADTGIASRALRYEVEGKPFEVGEIDALVAEIEARRKMYDRMPQMDKKGDFYVEVRADYRVVYGDIKQVLTAIGKAGIPKMAITANLQGS